MSLSDTRNTPNVHNSEPIPQAAFEEIERLLASGDLFRYTSESGPVTHFEQEFAAFIGTRYALAVSSCSSALFLSLKALDLPREARVLMPAFTFAAVPSAIVHANCKPVLCEVGENYRIDLDHFHTLIDQNIACVMISHMRGHTSDIDAIMAACDLRGIPVVEDAAHSLGTLWGGRRIGTFGKIGCFSFQSYKLLNAGEGGILVTDDPELAARATLMSGAYEHFWKRHHGPEDIFRHWQNRLPHYNMRMQNLSAVILRPQVPLIDERAESGRINHDFTARILNGSARLEVPAHLPNETRAPDSIQFNLIGMETDDEALAFQAEAKRRGVSVQIFGLSKDNARAFWNWRFLDEQPLLQRTRAMLMRACDVRLPVHLTRADCRVIGDALTAAAEAVEKRVTKTKTSRHADRIGEYV